MTRKISRLYIRLGGAVIDYDKSRGDFARFSKSNNKPCLEVHRARNELKMMFLFKFENGKNSKMVKKVEKLERKYKINPELIDKIIDQFMTWFNDADTMEIELQCLNIVGLLTKLRNELTKLT